MLVKASFQDDVMLLFSVAEITRIFTVSAQTFMSKKVHVRFRSIGGGVDFHFQFSDHKRDDWEDVS